MHVFEFRSFPDNEYRCRYCGLVFDSLVSLNNHINKTHKRRYNDSRSSGSFKREECGIIYEELFNVDKCIILPNSSFDEISAIFAKLQMDLEKSEELKSENKTEKNFFKVSTKIKNKDEIKVEGPEKNEKNATEEKQDPAELQDFFLEIEDRKPEINKSSN
ncbi:uncharacterized protein LOC111622049 [Centruroides sculpturatus]|uniref:uncharacterized protein LOC111622049 n=1 Tax=Centruroides sculpturatus TaxID=218467 RepID=UPI000C6E3FA0|nr:uncharacterized protein LOC111622049 [Centruroides sculpturatus]